MSNFSQGGETFFGLQVFSKCFELLVILILPIILHDEFSIGCL